jgi:hypothetical protein
MNARTFVIIAIPAIAIAVFVASCQAPHERDRVFAPGEFVTPETGDPDEFPDTPDCGAVAMQFHGTEQWVVMWVPDGTDEEIAACVFSVLEDQNLTDTAVVIVNTVNGRVKEVTWGCIKAGGINC